VQQTLAWMRTYTLILVATLAIAFLVGIVLRLLVKRSTLQPSHALRVIESFAVIVGGAVGSVVCSCC
jgi:uncharacterized membrane protein YidH (DUF202 family)